MRKEATQVLFKDNVRTLPNFTRKVFFKVFHKFVQQRGLSDLCVCSFNAKASRRYR